jgi:two-component system, chemotaxis family, protein-glutamate methylesterase/glutaminase
MSKRGRDIIVVGTSAGGSEALTKLIGLLPSNLPATIFIVQHMPADSVGDVLVARLQQANRFPCTLAKDQERFRRGHLYIAPPDCHLLLKTHHVLVAKGARENRYRPAIDPLFRSAAVSHGPRVIGVILSGQLDDGTLGMRAIKMCGGLTVVQDPKDAEYPEMPQSVINHVSATYCVPLAEMGSLLNTLVRKTRGKRFIVPAALRTEAVIAERVLSDVRQLNTLGPQVPYNCPNCGGVLWDVDKSGGLQYRCHTGHSFTTASLLTSQSEKIEETLWVALRMFEERKNLLNNTQQREASVRMKHWYGERARETNVHVKRIRAMLLASQAIKTGHILLPPPRKSASP